MRRPTPSEFERGRPAKWRDTFWPRIIATSDPRHRLLLIAVAFLLITVIGAADFLTGTEISLLVFYCLPVCLTVIAGGWRLGVCTAILSVSTWLAGDYAAGAHFANPLVPCWNALIALGTYLVVIWLLASLVGLQREMERRVLQRTAALTEEIAERERLERAVLEISERERLAIGRDLHDGLSQHLTGTALVAQAVGAQLENRHAPEAGDVRKIVGLVEQGIEQTRSLARGLLLAEIEANGLMTALEELAASVRSQFRVTCEFTSQGSAGCSENGSATHLFRIAQEATRNAVRHGRARRVAITLNVSGAGLLLRVRDDGIGLPPSAVRGEGLGLRIMAHRSAIIGARFTVEAQPEGGTLVECHLPPASNPS